MTDCFPGVKHTYGWGGRIRKRERQCPMGSDINSTDSDRYDSKKKRSVVHLQIEAAGQM